MRSLFYRLSAFVWFVRSRGMIRGRSFRIKHPQRVSVTARLTIGRGTVIDSGATLVVRTPSKIGANVYFGPNSHVVAFDAVTVEDRVLLGERVSLHTENHGPKHARQTFELAPIVLEADAWIAAGAVVLPGVTVGSGSIVAANAVVNQDVRPNTLVAGIPAVEKKQLSADDA